VSKIEFYSKNFFSATKVSSPSWWLSTIIHDGVMMPYFMQKSIHISNLKVLIDGWLVGWMFLVGYYCWTMYFQLAIWCTYKSHFLHLQKCAQPLWHQQIPREKWKLYNQVTPPRCVHGHLIQVSKITMLCFQFMISQT